MNQEKIGKFIANCRKKKKLSQTDLATKIGVTNKAISKWENGRCLPDVSLMQPLCKELNITVNELLNGAKDKEEDKVIIDYIKYEKKKSKKKTILITIISLLLITFILSTTIYFFNNYGKITTYELSGSTENFSLTGAIFIKSKQNNILNIGKITIENPEIKEEDVKAISLTYKENVIYAFYGKDLISKNGTLIQESDGYNEYFSEEKINNIKDWTLTIEYTLNEETKKDVIDITTNELLKNDEIISLKDQPISEDTSDAVNRKEEIDKMKKEKLEHFREILPTVGYTTKDKKFYKKTISENEYYFINIDVESLEYVYKENETTNISLRNYLHSKDTIVTNDSISGSGTKDGEKYNFVYDVEEETIDIYIYIYI